jgi:hypothetical protein
MNHLVPYAVSAFAGLVGGVSLVAFAGFLFAGPVVRIDIGLQGVSILVFDALVSLGFFLTHSGMIRKSFRRRLAGFMPEHYHGAFYTIASGAMLLALVWFWQPSERVLVSLQGIPRVLARGVFIVATIGFWYGVRSLRSFDALGLKPLRAHIRGKNLVAGPIAIRGAYRWVRHPLYFFVLMMMWSFPDLMVDRIVFNVLWTGWIVVGAYLEERDLIEQFGDAYRSYQRRVPMLVPLGPPVSEEDVSPSIPDAG